MLTLYVLLLTLSEQSEIPYQVLASES